jgi:hypothetical protein
MTASYRQRRDGRVAAARSRYNQAASPPPLEVSMSRSIAFLLCIAALATGSAASAAGEFSTLEERMTDAEFRAAGLDRLTADELANLNAWLARRNLSTRPAPAGGSQGFKPEGLLGDSGDRARIVSRATSNQDEIGVGTTIALENGQSWRVTDGNLSLSGGLAGRTVTIEPALLGSWLLKVEGYNRSLRATRVR